jgi:hypothetical protein
VIKDRPATAADLREALMTYATREYVIEREKDVLKWVVHVSLIFFGIQVSALLAVAGLILAGVYWLLTHVHPAT